MKTLVLLFLGIPTAWAGQVDPLAYLNKMGEALKNLNYHGTLVYSHDGILESMQLIHKSSKDGEHERLVHLSGSPREVIRNNDVVTSYLPDSQSVVVRQRRFNSHLLAKLTQNFSDFVGTYNIKAGGIDRVAGKKARLILIQPKDIYRYGYRLLIDEASGLLLKSELTENEKVLEQMMFVQIQVMDSIPDPMLQPGVSGDRYTWHRGGKGAKDGPYSADKSWQIKNLPSGFVVSGRYKQQMQNNMRPAEHMVITDGLASVSVYIEHVGEQGKGYSGAYRKGAINIFGSMMKSHQITVVGEVPHQTVKLIAQSLNHLEQK